MVTGPMPRKPKATRPKANTAGASISGLPSASVAPRPVPLTRVGDAHQAGDHQAHPEGGEVAGDEAGEHVERRAALLRRLARIRARAPSWSR